MDRIPVLFNTETLPPAWHTGGEGEKLSEGGESLSSGGFFRFFFDSDDDAKRRRVFRTAFWALQATTLLGALITALAAPWLGEQVFTTPGAGTSIVLGVALGVYVTVNYELTIALFASGGLSATLPKQFWDEVTLEVSPTIAAVSTCLFAFVGALIALAEWLRRRSANR